MKSYFDIAGDGGSDVIAQVTAQRAAITKSLAEVRHLVAIGSGKGGVGKSTVTMAVARALVARGKDVAILDADLNGPCQARMAGLEKAPWVPGPRGIAIPRRGGLGVISCGSFLGEAAPLELPSVARGDEQVWRATRELATLGQLLAGVDWGRLDFLLVDLPPGAERGRQYADFFGPRARFVVVTIPTDLARGVVARSLTALERAGARVVGYVENMAGYYHRDDDRVLPLFPPASDKIDPHELDAPCLGRLPFDPELAKRCDVGWPEDKNSEDLSLPGLDPLVDELLAALETADDAVDAQVPATAEVPR